MADSNDRMIDGPYHRPYCWLLLVQVKAEGLTRWGSFWCRWNRLVPCSAHSTNMRRDLEVGGPWGSIMHYTIPLMAMYKY